MTDQTTALDAQLWRTERPAYETTIDPTAPAGDGPAILVFSRDLIRRLAALTGNQVTTVVYRQSALHIAPQRQWRTLSLAVSGHQVLIVTTADPFVPGEWVSDVFVDDEPAPYSMTYSRPLAEVLGDAAWRGIQAVRRRAETAPDRAGH